MESKKVIHVHLKDQSFNGKTDLYFGSVAAIYEKMNNYILGIKENYLNVCLLQNGGEYENDRCKITRGVLIRKTSIRRKDTNK